MGRQSVSLLSFWMFLASIDAFGVILPPTHHPLSRTTTRQPAPHPVVTFMAGFGAAGGDNKKKSKEIKLKPKAQWDRYVDLKGETMVRVGVRKVGGEGDSEWLEAGRVRSKGSTSTTVAVARQRALIAEHARRLFPLQVSTKDALEWAYWNEDDEEWIVVDHKSVSMEKGMEKQIGFEGRPDPNTGFYCLYKEGRLVDTETPKQ